MEKTKDKKMDRVYQRLFDILGIIEGIEKRRKDDEDERNGWETFPEVINVRERRRLK